MNVANENIGHVEGSNNEDHVKNPSRTIPILQEDYKEIVSCSNDRFAINELM